MRIDTKSKLLSSYILAWIGFAILVVGASRVVAPSLDKHIQMPPADQIREAENLRRVELDLQNPPVIQREVDYLLGRSASWYPRNESPILADLVREGKLPPVAERVGPEPCVMEGVEGIGKFGGTWIRAALNEGDIKVMLNFRLSAPTLLRWSPNGLPLVPHAAKSYTVSPDSREFIFHLRKGMKWSDGHPFTADDILYWWEDECNNPELTSVPPLIMVIRGKLGKVEKIDRHTIKFTFPEPNGLFLTHLATSRGTAMMESPAHYLRHYHPTIGDPDMIKRWQNARRLPDKLSVYRDVKDIMNPDHPRLWPWIYRTYKSTPPQTVVRNPYYWVVDTKGNQLPYVDRVLFQNKPPEMINIAAANGELSMQARHIRAQDYTLLMNQRKRFGYSIYHWYSGDTSPFLISPNLNLRVDPDRPETEAKHRLLNDKRFRQALSIAINREDIIKAVYNGYGEPAQCAPGPASVFYNPKLYKAFVQYDPDEANRLLDEIGLTARDSEGYRMFPSGPRLTFFLNYCEFTGLGPGQFIVDYWAKVGIRVKLRERSRNLFYTEKAALKHDLSVWGGNGEYFPITEGRVFVPVSHESLYAIGFGRWWARDGLYGGNHSGPEYGCIEPPKDHPLRQAMVYYDQVISTSDLAEQIRLYNKVLDIAAENIWTINMVSAPPSLVVVKDGFRNVPKMAVISWDFATPGNTGPETYFFDDPRESAGAMAHMKREILNSTSFFDVPVNGEKSPAKSSAQVMGGIVKYAFLAIGALLILMLCLKHPFVIRRLLILIPTLIVISVIVFTVIQLPPGDFIATRLMQLEMSGEQADLQQIENIKAMFHLEEPITVQYLKWLGLPWFLSFDQADAGLLQGNLGRSMESMRPVNEIVGDRILLTVVVSFAAILFTWALAIPIGIYSAVKQYSIADYILTFIGFLGMCVPGFLLALLFIYAGQEWFGHAATGLFSSRYAAQPEWDMGKIVDLLKHIWVVVVVLGIGSTAGMIRIMRANLLDELKKPYVTTARAKGVRPMRLLLKYPVRLAMNPFISGIGGIFPQLVSGGAIVAIVLALPLVGPMLLEALMLEDMYLAGSMLMVLSVLSVAGTLVSDLLLLWLDPRIRFEGK